jgi:hypothetical protein
VGTVAGAEPATIVTSLADWHATQVCAHTCIMLVQHVSDPHKMSPLPATGRVPAEAPQRNRPGSLLTQHDQPLRLLHTVLVVLGIT